MLPLARPFSLRVFGSTALSCRRSAGASSQTHEPVIQLQLAGQRGCSQSGTVPWQEQRSYRGAVLPIAPRLAPFPNSCERLWHSTADPNM